MVGIKIGLPEQILKCLPVQALGVVGIVQGLSPGDSSINELLSDKRDMVPS